MRWILGLVALGVVGCTATVGDEGDPPFDPASDDAAASETGEEGEVGGEAGGDAGAMDASIDASEDSGPSDTGADSMTPDTSPPDTAKDPIDELCAGFTTSPFEPPSVCDASSGNTTTEIPANRIYSTSWFGCYRKTDGTIYKDPTDNCEFACGNKGLCAASATGPQCESDLQWFAADADRYGCGSRIRVTNCLNRKQVVLVTLDKGPNCKSVEKSYGAPVLDMSHPAMVYLFDGKTYGGSDKKRVIIEKVAATSKLGPVM